MVFVKRQVSMDFRVEFHGSGCITDSPERQVNISDSACHQQICARDEPSTPGADGANRKEET
jgi:hypothetical protein